MASRKTTSKPTPNRKLVIPKNFKCIGFDINVRYSKEPMEDRGYEYFDRQEIVIAPESEDYPRQQVEQSFLHEVTHFILDCMEQEKLSKDEKFVNLFSSLLYQALTTQEGDIDA